MNDDALRAAVEITDEMIEAGLRAWFGDAWADEAFKGARVVKHRSTRDAMRRVAAAILKAADESDDACGICLKPLKAGDPCLNDADRGAVHADCCGPEREAYVGADGQPLKDGEPLPTPFLYVPLRRKAVLAAVPARPMDETTAKALSVIDAHKFEWSGDARIGAGLHHASKTVAAALRTTQATLDQVTQERDEADRRAGEAERRRDGDRDTLVRLTQWRERQKEARGYDYNVSFDIVWAETCAKADKAATLQADLAEARARTAEEAAAIIEKNVISYGSRGGLIPRPDGDRSGLEYAVAIRAALAPADRP